MLKAMFSGVTGLRSHQTMMDVIGNNIANVNTVGFKASRALFTDVFYQTLSGAGDSVTNGVGGTNPSQIGYGAQVASIDVLNTQGNFSQTDKTTDLYISGEGYFVVYNNGSTQKDVTFTRVGNFKFDEDGYLVDSWGNHVRGDNGPTPNVAGVNVMALDEIQVNRANYSNVSIAGDGKITGINNTTGTTEVLGQIALATFNNADGLSQVGNMYLQATMNSGDPIIGAPATTSTGTLVTSGLEMSNVDLSRQFTDMIIAQRGFQANSRVITTSDEILQELVNLKR